MTRRHFRKPCRLICASIVVLLFSSLWQYCVAFSSSTESVPYSCWEPANGLSSPVLTILTVIVGLEEVDLQFIHQNRAAYALKHGYRFCEIYVKADPERRVVFTRIPIALALLPCTDFLIHLDADAVIVNPEYSLLPWMSHMVSKQLDVLLSNVFDDGKWGPINFGVFMLRPSPWVYQFFQSLYNYCPCDKGRICEQMLLVDFISQCPSDDCLEHVGAVKATGWNSPGSRLGEFSKDDLVVHFAGVDTLQSRMIEIRLQHQQAVREGFAADLQEDFEPLLVWKEEFCTKLRFVSMMGLYTYGDHSDSFFGSALHLQYNDDGELTVLDILRIPCVPGTCELKYAVHGGAKLWNPTGDDVVVKLGFS